MSACGKCGATDVELASKEGVEGLRCADCVGANAPRPDGAYGKALSSVKPQAVDWLWPGRIPLGMLSLLVGDPGLGKSMLTVRIAAKVTRAGANALMLSAEDAEAQTIRPRAEAEGADLDRIFSVKMSRDGMDEGLRFPDDCDALDALIKEHEAKLVVIDPLMAHLADAINSHSDKETRGALAPVAAIAERQGCAIVLVAHLNKSKGADPTHRTGGSIAVPAAVRSALVLARDPEDPDGERGMRRVVAHFKCNVAPLADSESYVVEPIKDGEIETARLRRLGVSETSGHELLRAGDSDERAARTEAAEILAAELADGPRSVKAVRSACRDAGVSDRTLDRAKTALGVESKREGGIGGDGEWIWSLPLSTPTLSTPTPLPPLGALSTNGSSKPDSDPPAPLSTPTNGNGVLSAEDTEVLKRAADLFDGEVIP